MADQALIQLKVAAVSSPAKVATSIAANLREGKAVETISIGAGAVNQALKAVVIARGLTGPWGWDLVIRPGFLDLIVEGEIKTGLRLAIHRRG